MVVVALEHLGGADRPRAPVHLDDVLPHVGRLPRGRNGGHVAGATSLRSVHAQRLHQDVRDLALFLPQEVVVGEEAPAAARLGSSEQVLGLEEGEYLQGQLLRQQRDKVPLELRLDHLHHVANLGGLAVLDQQIDRHQPFDGGPALLRRSSS